MENTTWYREEENKDAYAPLSCCLPKHSSNVTCMDNTETLNEQVYM